MAHRWIGDHAWGFVFFDVNLKRKIMEVTIDLAEKLLDILEKIDEESRTILQNELMKTVPTEKSEVVLKPGGGTFPEDNEYSMGLFVQVSHPQPNPESQPLNILITNLIDRATADKLEILGKVLDKLDKSIAPYEFRYMDTQIVTDTIKAFHFSLIGKLK